ncbi:unnamed protein product [Protopolystoma xenopodis]|uniref:Uncharacterized protein n=1 Tax=Protopolystoma xenopodis TaxID=117903 RepID=A0A448WPJ8_9PLAT|nr:unnamed protein product [Protopolystoma xenopodis]
MRTQFTVASQAGVGLRDPSGCSLLHRAALVACLSRQRRTSRPYTPSTAIADNRMTEQAWAALVMQRLVERGVPVGVRESEAGCTAVDLELGRWSEGTSYARQLADWMQEREFEAPHVAGVSRFCLNTRIELKIRSLGRSCSFHSFLFVVMVDGIGAGIHFYMNSICVLYSLPLCIGKMGEMKRLSLRSSVVWIFWNTLVCARISERISFGLDHSFSLTHRPEAH